MPDIVKKKKEIKDQIIDGPKNVIAGRTDVLENVQFSSFFQFTNHFWTTKAPRVHTC